MTLLWGLPFTLLLVIGLGLLLARLHGLTPISIRSGSMEPTIPTYALAFMEHAPPEEIVRGDIITFDPPGRHARVTHRVVQRTEHDGKLLFETRGDANPNVDDWRTSGDTRVERANGGYSIERQQRGVSYGSARGIRYVFHVPWLGYGGVLLERPNVRRYGPYAPFVLLGIWALSVIWIRPKDAATETRRRRVARADTVVDLPRRPEATSAAGDVPRKEHDAA